MRVGQGQGRAEIAGAGHFGDDAKKRIHDTPIDWPWRQMRPARGEVKPNLAALVPKPRAHYL
jgi:hypothetical protein